MIAIMLIALGAQFANAGIPRVSLDMLMAASIRLISGPLLAFALVGFFDLPALERNVGIFAGQYAGSGAGLHHRVGERRRA
ncbi:MAG: hypothetical protein KatS3mg052_0965 [Candidatus Roseilinea sp.]|nr:MAG: hypothetical protein KatS3mg052_0965 [Candidatus Roseilinea sp.]